MQGIRLMHLCEYHYADVVLTLAYASVYFRSAFASIGQKMSDYEASLNESASKDGRQLMSACCSSTLLTASSWMRPAPLGYGSSTSLRSTATSKPLAQKRPKAMSF